MRSEGHEKPERGISVRTARGGARRDRAPAAMRSEGHAKPERGISVRTAWEWGPKRQSACGHAERGPCEARARHQRKNRVGVGPEETERLRPCGARAMRSPSEASA